MAKERIDLLLVKRGLFETRERAQAAIMAGLILVNDRKTEKAGTKVPEDATIRVLGDAVPYVSRGGLKLEKAIAEFGIDLTGKALIDVGASTGGFTDCALQNGAAKVYAIDVGYGQLAWKLRGDPRVVNMERTNIRAVTPEMIGEAADFAGVDVAFISLTKVLGVVSGLLKPEGEILALIKPQFEAGRSEVGKKGVVKDAGVHRAVIESIVNFCREIPLYPVALTFSPIKGAEGNIEYLIHLAKSGEARVTEDIIAETVNEAHKNL